MNRHLFTTEGYYRYDEACLRPEVETCIEHLKQHATHQASIGPIVSLLTLVEQCLTIHQMKRRKAVEVASQLGVILSIAKSVSGNFFRDVFYCAKQL
jgi:hypothetical protein